MYMYVYIYNTRKRLCGIHSIFMQLLPHNGVVVQRVCVRGVEGDGLAGALASVFVRLYEQKKCLCTSKASKLRIYLLKMPFRAFHVPTFLSSVRSLMRALFGMRIGCWRMAACCSF